MRRTCCPDVWAWSPESSTASRSAWLDLGAAALGQIADLTSIDTVYRVCSFLPLIGLLTAFLPDVEQRGGPR